MDTTERVTPEDLEWLESEATRCDELLAEWGPVSGDASQHAARYRRVLSALRQDAAPSPLVEAYRVLTAGLREVAETRTGQTTVVGSIATSALRRATDLLATSPAAAQQEPRAWECPVCQTPQPWSYSFCVGIDGKHPERVSREEGTPLYAAPQPVPGPEK